MGYGPPGPSSQPLPGLSRCTKAAVPTGVTICLGFAIKRVGPQKKTPGKLTRGSPGEGGFLFLEIGTPLRGCRFIGPVLARAFLSQKVGLNLTVPTTSGHTAVVRQTYTPPAKPQKRPNFRGREGVQLLAYISLSPTDQPPNPPSPDTPYKALLSPWATGKPCT